MKNNVLIGAGVVLALILGGFGALKSSPASVVVPQPLGSISGPDIQSSYLRIGGVMRVYARQDMKTATTTLCAMISPVATSTIFSANWIIGTGTTTASAIDIGYGSTAFATSTNLLAGTAVASGAQGDANWTATGNGTGDDIVGPNTYVIVKTIAPGLSGYTYGG